MNKYNVGDLVWIPDGTSNFTKIDNCGPGYRNRLSIKGPTYGLILDTSCLDNIYPAGKNWLSVQVKNEIYIVHEKDVRKVSNEESRHD